MLEVLGWCIFFLFKQKTEYEIGWCDWSSDVCSSDLAISLAGWSWSRGLRGQANQPRLPRCSTRSEERRVGKSVPSSVDLGGRRIIKKKKKNKKDDEHADANNTKRHKKNHDD